MSTLATGAPSNHSAVMATLREGINVPESYPNAAGDMHSFIEDSYHLIINADGSVSLFDYEADPAESNDLAKSPEADSLVNALRDALDAAMAPPTDSARARAVDY